MIEQGDLTSPRPCWFVRQVGLDVEVIHVGPIDWADLRAAIDRLRRPMWNAQGDATVPKIVADMRIEPCGVLIAGADAELVWRLCCDIFDPATVHLAINAIQYAALARAFQSRSGR